MLYKLNVGNAQQSTKVAVKQPVDFSIKEKQIEQFVGSCLGEFVSEDDLMLIGQERPGQEEADLLALDRTGVLYIFELKRWESSSENILQVMRYGQIFGRYTYRQLENLAKTQQKLDADGELRCRHKEYFDLRESLSESEFNQRQHFVLITNGVDADTISAVDYWKSMGVEISCSPYRLYDICGEPYIQFDTFSLDDGVVPETETEYFIVNTNRTWMEDAWRAMLGDGKTGKAAAYGNRRWAIRRLNRDSVVYLYHTGVGVIAKGRATSEQQQSAEDEEEWFVPLELEWAVTEDQSWKGAIPAWRINERLNAGHKFRQTVFAIPREFADAIDALAPKGTTA